MTEKIEPTDAQYVIARNQLRSDKCPHCGKAKDRAHCFCRRCYWLLPQEMRGPLWIKRITIRDLQQWTEAYSKAKKFLDDLSVPLFGGK